MYNIFAVGIGGFVGAVARYLVYTLVRQQFTISFPLATLLVNIIGCFALGSVSAYTERQAFHPQIMLLLSVGLIGGFTTFSAFSMETMTLLKNGQLSAALLSVSGNLLSGFVAVWLGNVVIKTFAMK